LPFLPCSLVALPVGLTADFLARADLKKMKAGLMDPQGARGGRLGGLLGGVGAALGLAAWVPCGILVGVLKALHWPG
jgi:hypothetical protein